MHATHEYMTARMWLPHLSLSLCLSYSSPFLSVCFHTCRMVPHKTARGVAALERMKVFEGVPAPYDKVKRMVVPDALQPLRLQKGHKFCELGDLSTSVSVVWSCGFLLVVCACACQCVCCSHHTCRGAKFLVSWATCPALCIFRAVSSALWSMFRKGA